MVAATVGPMNFLALAQRLQSESGTSGAPQTTVLNATGEWLRLCNWIANAYTDLQNKRQDWLWMEHDVEFDTISGQQVYPPASTVFTTPAGTGLPDFKKWNLSTSSGENSFRLWLKSAGNHNETFLSSGLSYPEFRDYYQYGAKRDTLARPISIVVDPAKSIQLGLTPNDVYTVVGKYFSAPKLLAADADVPDFPDCYHMLIVWMALEQYGIYQSSPEVIARAQSNGKPLLQSLEDEQMEEIGWADPLVD